MMNTGLLSLCKSLVFSRVPDGDLLDVILGDFLGFLQFSVDREFRTYQAAKAALDAVFGLENYFRRVIAFGIESFANLEASIRTKLYTKAATFAPTFYNMNFPLGDRVSLSVQGQAPKFHIVFSTEMTVILSL
jgi:hypothetical protein